MNNLIKIQNSIEEIKDNLLNILFEFPEKVKKTNLKEVDEIRKYGIAIKNFQIVSIAM